MPGKDAKKGKQIITNFVSQQLKREFGEYNGRDGLYYRNTMDNSVGMARYEAGRVTHYFTLTVKETF